LGEKLMRPTEKLQFKVQYLDVKNRIKHCGEMIKIYQKSGNKCLHDIWEGRLRDAINTLQSFDLFISIFPELNGTYNTEVNGHDN